MTKTASRKLSLHRETIQPLQDTHLARIQGGQNQFDVTVTVDVVTQSSQACIATASMIVTKTIDVTRTK